jgi:hypothetical protein
MDQVKSVARAKFGSDEESYVSQILGTCRSMGISIGEEGKALLLRKRVVKKVEEPAPAAATPGAPAAAGTVPASGAPSAGPGKTPPPPKKEKEKKRKVKKGK